MQRKWRVSLIVCAGVFMSSLDLFIVNIAFPAIAKHFGGASLGIAAAAGPPLGGLLVQADWRWVFLVNVPVGLAGLAFGARTLAERRELGSGRPDALGAAALIVAVGSLVVAIVKGQEWGWGSPAILALLALTAVLLPAIWWRCERHISPIIEPAMLRVRSFGLAVGASVLFFAGFGAMLLAGVLFLTSVWHEDVLSAGLMLFPGPAMATAFSVPSAHLGARLGYRLPGVVGAALFAAGSISFITQTGEKPAYVAEYLPGMAIGGAGVGLVIPTLTGAGASSLAPERFATGAAVLTMGRQIGAALGVAVLVAVLGAGRTASDFQAAWLMPVDWQPASRSPRSARRRDASHLRPRSWSLRVWSPRSSSPRAWRARTWSLRSWRARHECSARAPEPELQVGGPGCDGRVRHEALPNRVRPGDRRRNASAAADR
jgi:Major Facilitator Superfamily